MIFNLANPYDLDRYKEYVNSLYTKKAVVEVKEKRNIRSLRQNAYLHTIISYFACEYGCTAEEAKLDYYKKMCNKDLFVIKKETGTAERLKQCGVLQVLIRRR